MNARADSERSSLARVLRSACATWAAWTGGVALVLTVLVVRANPHAEGIGHVMATALAMLWLAALSNAGMLLPLLLLWPLLRLERSPVQPRSPRAWFSFGIFGLIVAWTLWNHLQMAHQPVSVRPFITNTGILELAGIAAIVVLVWLAGGLQWISRVGRSGPTAIGRLSLVALAMGIAGALLALDANEASRDRTYTMDEVRRAARNSPGGPVSSADVVHSPMVLLVGIDGLSWGVAQPLLEQGQLPSLAALIDDGRIGYLDNGTLSFSPPVWTSIFTGQTERAHGVHGFQKFQLTLSGQSISKIGTLGDTFDTFYGLNHLMGRLPSLGMWSSRAIGSTDRRVPAIWNIAGHHGIRVVAVNPLMARPVEPINGAIVNLVDSWTRGAPAYQPVSLAERWGRKAVGFNPPTDAETYRVAAERLEEEVSFSIELIREYEPELAIFYTHFVDTVHHFNWDFHARDAFYLDDRPVDLSNEEWNAFVASHVEDRLFRSVIHMDEQLGRLRKAFPDSTIVVVSDHGWTFSGYEHFGSPDGVIIVSGPEVTTRAEITDAHIESITPTLLALMDVPLSREFPRSPLLDVLGESIAAEWVPRYELEAANGTPSEEGGEFDAADEARLRAIGYIE